jgi:hypothetical protein
LPSDKRSIAQALRLEFDTRSVTEFRWPAAAVSDDGEDVDETLRGAGGRGQFKLLGAHSHLNANVKQNCVIGMR